MKHVKSIKINATSHKIYEKHGNRRKCLNICENPKAANQASQSSNHRSPRRIKCRQVSFEVTLIASLGAYQYRSFVKVSKTLAKLYFWEPKTLFYIGARGAAPLPSTPLLVPSKAHVLQCLRCYGKQKVMFSVLFGIWRA